MTTVRKHSAIGRLVETLGSAIAAADATRSGRLPVTTDLEVLGIDPRQFARIRRG